MRNCITTAAVWFALASGGAAAAGKTPTLKGIPLEKSGLKACIDLESGMRQKIAAYNAEVRASNARVDRGRALKNELDALLALAQEGKAEMADYNARVDAYNAFVNETEDRRVLLSEISVEHDRLASTFNRDCAGRPFRNSDMVDLKRRR